MSGMCERSSYMSSDQTLRVSKYLASLLRSSQHSPLPLVTSGNRNCYVASVARDNRKKCYVTKLT